MNATEKASGVRLLNESIPFRRCLQCNWKAPAYLGACQYCAAALGDSFEESVVVISPELGDRGGLPELILPVAALVVELSGSWWSQEHLVARARGLADDLAGSVGVRASLTNMPKGSLAVLFAGDSFHEVATEVVHLAERLRQHLQSKDLEVRAGMTHGIADCARPWDSTAVKLAERLARAAQPGQTLTTIPMSSQLHQGWDFFPAGLLPRRKEDAVQHAILFAGRKAAASTPSAIGEDDGRELVGRRRELRVMSDSLRETTDGAGMWLAVVAPAGGGKSKLLRTWVRALRDRGTDSGPRIIGTSCSPFGVQPLSLINSISSALGAELPFGTSTDEAFAVLSEAIRRSAQEQSLPILIDDLHWADGESLKVLKLIHSARFRRCLFMVALRSYFLSSVSWLREARTLSLDGLDEKERESLVRGRLGSFKDGRLVRRLIRSKAGANPLYLEQCIDYALESGERALPKSLHEVILKRLELLRDSVSKVGGIYGWDAGDELSRVERTVGEWLDRLETSDHEGRKLIAEYLSMLRAIDSELFIRRATLGIASLRNRRLDHAFDRFYSATGVEGEEVIKHLARKDKTNAAYAAEVAAERALEGVRIDDAIRYCQLAVRYSEEALTRARNLSRLGDAHFASGSLAEAWRAYRRALWSSTKTTDEGTAQSATLGLVRVAAALRRWDRIKHLLAQTKNTRDEEQELISLCYLAIARCH
jgi:tetratricopeptide (TPR) repeat protein